MREERVECMECGRRWKTAHTSPICRHCGSVDIELASAAAAAREASAMVADLSARLARSCGEAYRREVGR